MANKKIVEFTELNLSQLNADDFNLYLQTLDGATDYRVLKSVLNDALGGGLLSITVSLTAEQIKNGASIPIDSGIPLQGANKFISVIGADFKYAFETEAFTSDAFELRIDTADARHAYTGLFLNFAGSNFGKFQINNDNNIQLVANKKLMITTTNDSATGDGTATIYILYRIINI